MMALTLKDDDNVNSIPYTDNERRIYAYIASRPNRIAHSTDVIKTIYGNGETPLNARIIVGGMLNTLMEKMDRNRTEMTLRKSKRQGPHPIRWQIVERGSEPAEEPEPRRRRRRRRVAAATTRRQRRVTTTRRRRATATRPQRRRRRRAE